MAENLKQKAAKGLIWKFLEQGGTQFILFISGIYIARILSPEDYGLVGMMAIFLGVSQIFINSGFSTTLIQKGKEVTHDHYNVVFIFNITVSSFLYFLIFIGAPSISDFYNEPRLLWVARILGINLILSSFGLIHQTILQKRLNFKTLTKIKLVSVIVSVIVGIILAIEDYGVWALVMMTISENLVRVILISFINKWSPSFSFNTTIFKELFSKGIAIFLAGLSKQITVNIFSVVIGKYFTTIDVGFYSQGKKLQTRITDFLNNSIQGVMYPVQSLMKADILRLKNSVRKNVKITSLVIFPASLGIIVIANQFVEIFLTSKWLPSVYYLQILAIASMFYVLRSSVGSFLMPLGKFRLVLYLGVFNSIFLLILIVTGVLFDVRLELLILSKVIQEGFGLLAISYFAKQHVKYSLKEMLSDFLPSLLLSMMMAIVVYLIGIKLEIKLFVLSLQVLIGAGLFILLNYFFNKKLFLEVLEIIKSLIRK